MKLLESIKILAEECTVHEKYRDIYLLEKIATEVNIAEIVDNYKLFNNIMDLLIYSKRENYYASKDIPLTFINLLNDSILNERLDKQIEEDFKELINELNFKGK